MKLLQAVGVSLFLAYGVFAQSQAINGSIRGRVTDPAGAAVPAAKVDVTNTATGYTRSLVTNDEGYFVFPNLPLGTYTARIQKEGFETQRHTQIVLDAGTEAVIDSQLKVGAVSTTIDVSGGAPVIEPSRVSTGRTIDQTEIDNLPLTSRNPYNFILFQPGVSGHPNAELGIPRTINTNGLLDRINYQLDGMVDTETDRYGLRLFAISDIYVREVQTVSNSFAPEFGNTPGNIYNVITNSGTNDFHGEFYFIGRPPDANARTILLASNKPAASIDLHDYAVNAGGPIKKDKLFIFGGYEHLLRGTPVPTTIDPTAAAQIGIAPNLLATAPTVQHVQFLNFRADWIIDPKNQVFFRYNYFRNEYPFNTANGGLNALDAAADFRDRAHVAGFQWLSSFTPTLLNEFRASWPYRNEHHVADPLTGAGPQIVISAVAMFNGSISVGDRFAEKIPSFSDNVTWIHGPHTWKAGFGWQENNDNQVGVVYSQYTFANIASYLSAKSGATPYSYSTFKTVLGTPGASYKSYFWDLFLQDSWQLRPDLIVIYGIRYDRYQAPGGEANAPFVYTRSFRTPGADWSPRLGLAWSIDSKTVLRVSSGIFYEAPPTNVWYNAFSNDGSSKAFVYSLSPTSPGAPAFPAVFNYLPGATPTNPNIYAVTPNFKNAYTINSSIQITRQISTKDALTVGYAHTSGRNLEYLRNMNLMNPISTLADGRPVFSTAVNTGTRLYPQFNAITLQDIGAISDYNALITNWQHRFSAGFQMNASYTWSHSISDAPDANGFEQSTPIEDPTNRTRDRGNSLANRPNALTMSIILNPTFKLENNFWNKLANGNEISVLGNVASGDQLNMIANQVLNGDSTATSRPLYVGRDTLRAPNCYQFDARYTRTLYSYRERIKVKFLAESNNIFNHKNITSINATATVNSLGMITTPASLAPTSTVLEGRLLQLGIRADW